MPSLPRRGRARVHRVMASPAVLIAHHSHGWLCLSLRLLPVARALSAVSATPRDPNMVRDMIASHGLCLCIGTGSLDSQAPAIIGR